jgi:hypothetical protein
MRGSRFPLVVAVLLTSYGSLANAETPVWSWVLTPYIWASDTSADLSFADKTVEGGLDFDDLIEKVDLGSQLHLEGTRDRTGFFVDVTYLSISEREYRQPILPFDGQLRLKTKLDTFIGEAAGTYRVAGESKLNGFELMLGARVIDTEFDLDIDFPGPASRRQSVTASETLTDVFVGGRYIHSLSGNWIVALRGDIATGDSDHTYNGLAQLVYLFGQNGRFGAVLAYRYMKSEYESSKKGEQVDAELTMSGPALGFAFRF